MRLLLLGMSFFMLAFCAQMILIRFLIEQGNYEWFETCYDFAFGWADFCLEQIRLRLSSEVWSLWRIYLSLGIYSLGFAFTVSPLWNILVPAPAERPFKPVG